MKRPLSPSQSAVLEIGLLFLPAIPAYLWAWPNLKGSRLDIFQVLTYLYVLAGTLFIGLRRWNWSQLGLNRKGLGLTLACGAAILGGRLLIILSVDWPVHTAKLTWLSFIRQSALLLRPGRSGGRAALPRSGLPPAGRLATARNWPSGDRASALGYGTSSGKGRWLG